MDWLQILGVAKEVGPHGVLMVIMGAFGLRELSRMRKSVEQLNIGMAVVVERVHEHGRRISSLEKKK